MSTEVATRPLMESNTALQTALELSMLNLSNSPIPGVDPGADPNGSSPTGGYMLGMADGLMDCRPVPRSLNVTQCVAVPSSEHVAEIVGRQGCKIKALRAKTNTYIKTPVRGEDPVFVITGRPEDVSSAKREVLAAAEHFTQIRAAKTGTGGSRGSPSSPPSCLPAGPESAGTPNGGGSADQVVIYVKVPYRVVGLVVGPKGATIKRIQQITNTRIVTPSRDKEPCFEVSGRGEDVERVKKEIESYIAMRTGGCHDSDSETDCSTSATMSPSVDSGIVSPSSSISRRKLSESSKLMQQFSPRSSASPPAPPPNLTGPVYGVEALDNAYGNQWIEPATRSPLSSAVFGGGSGLKDTFSRSNSFSSCEGPFSFGTPPLSAPLSHSNKMFDFSAFREILKEDPPSPTYSCSSNSSDGLGVTSPKLPLKHHSHHGGGGVGGGMVSSQRLCYVCQEKEIVAALVPCGHNLFCASCAHVSTVVSGSCPVCATPVTSMLSLHQ